MYKTLTTAATLVAVTLSGCAGKIKPDQKAQKATTSEQTQPTPTLKKWRLPNGTATEQKVLDFFQEKGITDRAALAVLLGNIKQESKFDHLVCEGGQRTGYKKCNSGGFGLIYFCSVYNGYDGFYYSSHLYHKST